MQENLIWSLTYYEKNVKSSLYSKVYAELLDYSIDKRGGPLFLKILLDCVTTTNKANLNAIIHLTKTYHINKVSKGEDIKQVVVDLFTALYNNTALMKEGKLPEDTLRNLLKIFQSTSVPAYNDLFKNMERQRLKNKIKASINPKFAATLLEPGVDKLANNLDSVHFTLYSLIHRTSLQNVRTKRNLGLHSVETIIVLFRGTP